MLPFYNKTSDKHFSNSINQNHNSSRKGFAARYRRTRHYVNQVTDKFSKMIYQINISGSLTKWNSMQEISESLGVSVATIKYNLENGKPFNDSLFVLMSEYKSTVNYALLIKISKGNFKKVKP